MTEAAYQSKLIATFRRKGWHVLKLIKVSVAGYPDLQLTHPDRPTVYIEVKSDIGRLSEIQKYRHEQLKKEGFTVLVSRPSDFAATLGEVDGIIGPIHHQRPNVQSVRHRD